MECYLDVIVEDKMLVLVLQQKCVRAYLDVIIEDQMLVLVALQQCVSVLQLEVLKLQHCLGPSAHHCLHKLIQQLQQTQTLLSHHVGADVPHSQHAAAATAVARWMEQVTSYLEPACKKRYPAKRDIICSAAHMQGSCRSKVIQTDRCTDVWTNADHGNPLLPVGELLPSCFWEMRVRLMTPWYAVC